MILQGRVKGRKSLFYERDRGIVGYRGVHIGWGKEGIFGRGGHLTSSWEGYGLGREGLTLRSSQKPFGGHFFGLGGGLRRRFGSWQLGIKTPISSILGYTWTTKDFGRDYLRYLALWSSGEFPPSIFIYTSQVYLPFWELGLFYFTRLLSL